MAAAYKKETEHAFITIEKDLKEGRIPRLILLCGKEEYLIKWYTDALVNRFVSDACRPIDLVTLENDAASLSSIVENLETISLMSERKVVLMPDFAPVYGKHSKGVTETDIKGLIEYFSEIVGYSLALVLENERLFVGTPSQLAFVAEVYNINRVILLFLNVGQIISPNIGTWGTMTYNIHQQQPIPELITHIAIEPSCLTRRAREEHREAIA